MTYSDNLYLKRIAEKLTNPIEGQHTNNFYLKIISKNISKGGGGGSYDDTEIKRRITNVENGKQDKLTAGQNITIAENTIAAREIIDDTINSTTTVWSSKKVKDLIGALEGTIKVSIVTTRPDPSVAVDKTMYYVGTETPYHIWFFVNDSYTDVGTTEISLENYYTKEEVDELLDEKVDKVTGKSLVLDTDIAQITTNKVDIANIKDDEDLTSFGKVKLALEEKQDTITDSTLSTLTDSTTVSSVSSTSKTNKTFALSSLWDYIKGKITEVYYPVGSVVIRLDNTNPSATYGGTWELIGKEYEWDEVDWSDINLNSSSSSGLSISTSSGALGSFSVASGHRAKYKVNSKGIIDLSMRFKHSTAFTYTSSSYADACSITYKGNNLASGSDWWFMGALSGSDKGYSTINIHVLNGKMFFSGTSDNPVKSNANSTQVFLGCSFQLDNSTCDRTYYKFKRTA